MLLNIIFSALLAHRAPTPPQVMPVLVKAARAHAVPVGLAHAVGWRESRNRDGLRGRADEVGPLQVRPGWFGRKPCEELDPKVPYDRAACGVRLLAMGHKKCGAWERALGWYHHGGTCIADNYARAIVQDYLARWHLFDSLLEVAHAQ